MKWILLFLISTICLASDPLRVVVIDTGIDKEDQRFTDILCKDTDVIDYTNTGYNDVVGHGTHVVGLIKEYAKDSNYCITVIKYYVESNSGRENLKNLINALSWVHDMTPDFVNFSGGGPEWIAEEYEMIKQSYNTQFIVAIGNDNVNLDEHCDYYPACYPLDNIFRVGSLNQNHKKASTSNYGSIVNFWQIGENVKSTLPNNKEGYMSGTSMATAIQTGKLIYEKSHNACSIDPNSGLCYH